MPSPIDKDLVVKFLSDSFDYCSGVIPNLTDKQLNKTHNSRTASGERNPAGYVFTWRITVARLKSISGTRLKPPSYMI